MENTSNIISDEDFLKEILNDFKPEPIQPKVEQNDAEKLLEGTLDTKDDVIEDKTEKSTTPPVENQESEKKEEDIQLEEKSSLRRFGVKDTVASLIDNDTWVDMAIKYGEKEYDNITDLLEKEKPSKELFDMLSLAQKNHREDEIKQQYVKVGDKDSTKAKLVNAILHDIDYTGLLEYNSEVIEPLQRIDFSKIQDGDRVAEEFVKQCLVDIDNYHPESIEAVIKKLKEDFRLMDKAEEYQKITIEGFNREIEKRETEKFEKLRREETEIKEQFKTLKQEFKEKGMDDKFSNQLLKLRYTKDDNGIFHYEHLIKDKIKDKTFEAKFLHFLMDEEDFINTAKSKVKNETSKKYLELVNVIPKEKGAKQTKNPNNLQTDDDSLFEELGLI